MRYDALCDTLWSHVILEASRITCDHRVSQSETVEPATSTRGTMAHEGLPEPGGWRWGMGARENGGLRVCNWRKTPKFSF